MFGVADYAASLQSHTTSIGGANPDYAILTDREDRRRSASATGATSGTTPLSRIAVVCRAYGLRPIDGPFGDFTDPEGYLASARRAAVLGYEGKWAIHPSPDRAGQRGVHAQTSTSSRRPAGSSPP